MTQNADTTSLKVSLKDLTVALTKIVYSVFKMLHNSFV